MSAQVQTHKASKAKRKPLKRYVTGLADRSFGTEATPGIVTTSVTLFGGEPGTGKSTFFLQLLQAIYALTERPGVFVSDESEAQVRDRAARLGVDARAVLVLKGEQIDREMLKRLKPSVIFDDRGRRTGLLDLIHRYRMLAQAEKTPFFIGWQMTKSEDFAGDVECQHAADTLLRMFLACEIQSADKRVHHPPRHRREQGAVSRFRVLSCLKARFGDGDSESYWLMGKNGLVPWQVPKPEGSARKAGGKRA